MFFFLLTGFPVLISRVVYTNAHLLHVGDAILSINNESISNLTHDQVINKLRDASGDQVNLTVQYMNNMAPYLRSTTSTARSSISTVMPPLVHTSVTLPPPSSVRIRRQQNRMSAEYPSGYHRPGKQQQRLSLMLSDQQKVRINYFSERKFYRYNILYSELTNRDMQNRILNYLIKELFFQNKNDYKC
jgi:hypothetical protein